MVGYWTEWMRDLEEWMKGWVKGPEEQMNDLNSLQDLLLRKTKKQGERY